MLRNTKIHVPHLEREVVMLPLPVMKLNAEKKDIDGFVFEDFTLDGYDAWPSIKAEIAV